MQTTGVSATATTEDQYPSVVINAAYGLIDDDGAYGDEHRVPQIVLDDNKGWG